MTTPDTLFSIVLLLSSLLAALLFRRAVSGKHYGLVAALLFAIFALIHVVIRVDSVAVTTALNVIVAAGSAALGLSVYRVFAGKIRTAIALIGLVASASLAVAAAYVARPRLALIPLAAGVIALLVIGVVNLRANRRQALLVIASALALGAAGAAFAISGPRGFLLFGAAAIGGIALAVSPASHAVVNKRGWTKRTLSVRRKS